MWLKYLPIDKYSNINFVGFTLLLVAKNKFDFKDKLQNLIDLDGPILINVKLDPLQMFEPKLSSKKLPDGKMVSAPLEDMFPFLSESELASNMIIKTIKF